MKVRDRLKEKKRIVVKIGSSSLTHEETGRLNLMKMEILVRELADLHNQMMIYQKLFAEYNQTAAQILMTKYTMINRATRINAKNTFDTLLEMGTIPIVNENDTISTDEIEFGDNDTLSALVAALTGADMLILLSDIDGLFTDDPNQNPNAEFIDLVEKLDSHLDAMAKDTSKSSVGTGGMATKLKAAHIATSAGADMVIANGNDFHVIHKIMQGRNHGTLFLADKKEEFYLDDIIDKLG